MSGRATMYLFPTVTPQGYLIVTGAWMRQADDVECVCSGGRVEWAVVQATASSQSAGVSSTENKQRCVHFILFGGVMGEVSEEMGRRGGKGWVA